MFWKHFEKNKLYKASQKTDTIYVGEVTSSEYGYVKNQLVGQASSKEEAERIADMYGLKLLDCEYGNSLFEITDGRDPYDVIEYGKKMEFPTLYVNSTGEFLQ